MTGRASLQEVIYDGHRYLLFDDVEAFAKEVERSKKAILKTDFANIPNQVHTLFRLIAREFGDDSKEAHAVTRSRLYCAKCGVAYGESLLFLLIAPYKKSTVNIPSQCPKCGNPELLYLYRA